MVDCQSVIQNPPQLLAWLGALGSPPEPRSLCFVQWSPEHRYTCRLELLELHSDGVNVLDEERVVGIRRVLQCSLDVEVGSSRVEAAPPPLLWGVVETNRRAPMPHKGHNTALLRKGERFVDISGGGTSGDSGLGVIHQIDTEDRRCLANVVDDPVERCLVLLTTENLLAIDAA